MYDKDKIKSSLTKEQIFSILSDFGGEPIYTNYGIISKTICHNSIDNNPSYKLYYYLNSSLFTCYTGCENHTFDIFELIIKVMKIQNNKDYSLVNAMYWIINYLNLSGYQKIDEENSLNDWNYLKKYENLEVNELTKVSLKEYESNILNNFNYDIIISPWIKDHISKEVMFQTRIGYYPGEDQITIPHFDIDNRFIGLRGRVLFGTEEEIKRMGKYRPLKIMGQLYNHPLGYNLYGINWSISPIKTLKTAIIVESEKSVLQYMSYFGIDSNICLACCGSNITNYQMFLLKQLGVNNLIIGFDKQFKELNSEESKLWINKLKAIYNKYKNYFSISFLWDKYSLLDYKDSPLDKGKEVFNELFKKRIYLE